jgi:site-specific DNA-methyltransferase (cytosine-N4-specific)
MDIQIVNYKLYEYEKKLLEGELLSLGVVIPHPINPGDIFTIDKIKEDLVNKLTFVQSYSKDETFVETLQKKREGITLNVKTNTQSRRYGPHSLHEYKGRFNPQLPRSIALTNFGVGDIVLDPFNGSGTTSVECRGLGINVIGVELNKLAHEVALAKKYYEEVNTIPQIDIGNYNGTYFSDKHRAYLSRWFPTQQLCMLEDILVSISKQPEKVQSLLRVILSNLLRDHSYQEPGDLRIRRRDIVPDNLNLKNAFETSLREHIKIHRKWVTELPINKAKVTLFNRDSTKLKEFIKTEVDGTITSPPYASALPYIDTYRLSMVALGMLEPDKILSTEKSLIGARDITKDEENNFNDYCKQLPSRVSKVILDIYNNVKNDSNAGFRRKAVPYALAKYMVLMKGVLEELYSVERQGAKNYWVIGPNKVMLNGNWFVIETPKLISELSREIGFTDISVTPIQAYARYNIHSKNSITSEYVLYFRK